MLTITNGLHLNIFVKSLGCMLNNIHFAALHFLMCTMSSFAIDSQRSLVKFDAIQLIQQIHN